ncbi:MAG: hypothetical protein QOC82_2961 [Frankiaceae bacterium]|nr:hypothetical protein [Frankiaceae bacterium]
MKLVIRRNQAAKTGILGGNKGVQFTLAYQLSLSSEERQLVEQYKLHDYPVTWTTLDGHRIPETLGQMMAGRSQTLSDVTTLVQNEKVVKDACDQLPILFQLVRSFGGEETIEYPRANAD